jgi:hypothetical protein
LGQEQIGAFDDILVIALPILVEQLGHIRDIDGFRTATARHEQVRLVPEVGSITEVGSVGDDFPGGESNVAVVHKNDVAVFAKLGMVKVVNHHASSRETEELFAVDTVGICEHSGTINDSDIFLGAEKDFIWI